MKLNKRKLFIYVVFFLIPFLSASKCSSNNGIFIRSNQAGFLPSDYKSAVILSKEELFNEEIFVVESSSGITELKGKLGKSQGKFGRFNFSYAFNFTQLKHSGEYYIKIRDVKSLKFKIGNGIYKNITTELMRFFRVQRCGYTNPSEHEVCHKFDATSLIENGVSREGKIDVTGGWHDAADYIKFFTTTAFSTYTMLFAYDFDQMKYGFDENKNGTPDIIEEAKIGLDWLFRASSLEGKFVTQVQNLEDHDVGWRLPENDSKENERPAFIGIGKNLIGIYSATMALASRVWKGKFDYDNFSEKCLITAEKYYKIRNTVTDIDTNGTNHYRDNEFEGKLALAAVELYKTTGNKNYYNDAVDYAEDAGSDYWWSWGNINSFAHYRLAEYDSRFIDYIENNLKAFSETSNSRIFGEGRAITWGSNHTFLGISLQAILFRKLTERKSYDKLAVIHRDYILGRNQWGVSFVTGIGTVYSRNLHHQISYLKKILLPGGFAAGPVSRSYIEEQNIPYETRDRFAMFQTDEAYYRDDRMDYISNEPTISANATAVFVMGYFSGK